MNDFISELTISNHTYSYYDLKKVFLLYPSLKKLPNSLKLLLESNIRNQKEEDVRSVIEVFITKSNLKQIAYYPNRMILNEDLGIDLLVDLISIQNSFEKEKKDIKRLDPKIMFDLVISDFNNENENIKRKEERYKVAKWALTKFKNFSIVPPSNLDLDHVNIEYLSTMISSSLINGKPFIFPESITGIDTHTSSVNALGVLGIISDEIKIETALLGNSISLELPEVIGINITGSIIQGVSISDITQNLLNSLNEYELKGKILEFHGQGLRNLSINDRTTISNNLANKNILCTYFAVDDNCISFVEQTRGVDASLIREYYIRQGLYAEHDSLEYDEYLDFNLSLVKPILVGPKNFIDKVYAQNIREKINSYKVGNFVKDNDIVLAVITAYINQVNPTLLIQAGLLAKRACELKLSINKNIKCLVDLDSYLIKEYLEKLDLLKYFEKLGFKFIEKNSICDLRESVSIDIEKFNLNTSALYTLKESSEKITSTDIKSNWILSPALLLAYCLKGSIDFDITKESLSRDIFLCDIWPSIVEVNTYLEKIDNTHFQNKYKDIFLGSQFWQDLEIEDSSTYTWSEENTYTTYSNLFESLEGNKAEIINAKVLALLDDDINSELLCAKGSISPYSSTGLYLGTKGLALDEFDSFESRKANVEVMIRGALSNISIKNKIVTPKEGGYTKDFTTGEVMSMYDFSSKIKAEDRPLIIFAGHNFGVGELNSWSIKGLALLGIKTIVAKSFDKDFKSNLVSVGILPLEFLDDDIENLYLKGNELISVDINHIKTNNKIELKIQNKDEVKSIIVHCYLNNEEIHHYLNGGTFNYLVKQFS